MGLDLTGVWVEDLFYVYLGPFCILEKKDELEMELPFVAPEVLLCQEQNFSQQACDLWSLGVIYCCLHFDGFYSYIKSNIQSLEDYLIFFDLLVGYPQSEPLSYIPLKVYEKLGRLISKFKVEQDIRRSKKAVNAVFETDETVFDEELIASWS